MLFQNNNVNVCNEVEKDMLRWEKLQLSSLGRISGIKMNVISISEIDNWCII